MLPIRDVNPGGAELGDPNAYWVPLATPCGIPAVDCGSERGIFPWKDKRGIWRLQVTAGGGSATYSGEIVSDVRVANVAGRSLGEPDVLDASDPTRIRFNLKTWSGGMHELLLEFPAGASWSLALDDPELVAFVRVGDQKWPIARLPLDLSGW